MHEFVQSTALDRIYSIIVIVLLALESYGPENNAFTILLKMQLCRVLTSALSRALVHMCMSYDGAYNAATVYNMSTSLAEDRNQGSPKSYVMHQHRRLSHVRRLTSYPAKQYRMLFRSVFNSG